MQQTRSGHHDGRPSLLILCSTDIGGERGQGGERLGYDLHITKAKDWTDSETSPIAESDWDQLVASDADLEMTGVAEAETPDGNLRYENRGLAVWRRHPSGEKVWFDFRRGRVVVKNPDEATIEKMVVVARRLGARVVGDDGETYDEAGQPPTPAKLSLPARLSGWFQGLLPAKPPNISSDAKGPRDFEYRSLSGVADIVAARRKARPASASSPAAEQ